MKQLLQLLLLLFWIPVGLAIVLAIRLWRWFLRWFWMLIGSAIFLAVMLFSDDIGGKLLIVLFFVACVWHVAIRNSAMEEDDKAAAQAILFRSLGGLWGIGMLASAMISDDIAVLWRSVGAAFGALIVYAAAHEAIGVRRRRLQLRKMDDERGEEQITSLKRRINNLEILIDIPKR